ncbi:retron system putative HNH endonuclease [Tumebacillus permanentifrigoris]|uniref:Uncharacterized protein (TIGR02646 family) n=1 Tax=Tumebacillus permanentifrigoris TaxID=378543 RepID=A0A316D8I1_9BACL|nr:retron system putative HNH endonuclease [Tumebacillus permanentifrigoris]PWK11233.1 uncharacterized protein (TIGR02646 family) [Tumebacillus permanentifrigoris]
MRYIQKRSQPDWYRDFKRGKTHLSWDDFFKNDQQKKTDLKVELLQEQHYLCGYCGKSIDPQNSHIEHVIPKSRLPHRDHPGVTTYSFQNMLASCQSRRRPDGDDTCGHAKDRWYDRNLFISPHEVDCEGYFRFSKLGEIFPTSNDPHAPEYQRADSTINALRLNKYELESDRKSLVASFLGDDFDLELTPEEITLLLDSYQTPDAQGRLREYSFVAQQILRSL